MSGRALTLSERECYGIAGFQVSGFRETGDYNICVNTVSPGFVVTPV
jgi:NAD(P)-dependent dehydrogenase (short-subunit alcohol dehydrogenase family)